MPTKKKSSIKQLNNTAKMVHRLCQEPTDAGDDAKAIAEVEHEQDVEAISRGMRLRQTMNTQRYIEN